MTERTGSGLSWLNAPTAAIISTTLTVGAAIGATLVVSSSAMRADFRAALQRIDQHILTLTVETRDERWELSAEIKDVRKELGAEIKDVRMELGAEIKDVRGDIQALDRRVHDVEKVVIATHKSVEGFDYRLAAVEAHADQPIGIAHRTGQ